jgi:predicted metal-dependent hydrolase
MIGSSNSINEFLEKHQLIIQTTNVDQNLIVKTNNEQFNFEIIDIFGKQIQHGSIENGSNQINVFNLSSGLYLFKVKSNDGESAVLKFNKI